MRADAGSNITATTGPVSLNAKRILEFVLVCLLYAALTIAFLRFAVNPSELSTQIQTLDSILMAAILDHVSNALLGSSLSFWNFGIYYPEPMTLCLSEPMLTPAILLTPLMRMFGYVASYNLWVCFCWWSLAVAVWAYLRHLGIGTLAAFWGGLFASFNPDRLWHIAGHTHLFYQAGLFLALLALERTITTGAWRWKLAFLVAWFSQFFAGFYITAILAVWGAFVFPAAAYRACCQTGQRSVKVLFERTWFLLLVVLLGVILYLPVIHGYMEFGKERAHNSLEAVESGSATLGGYLVPPLDPGRILTIGGALITDRAGTADAGEDTQYLGIVAPLLALMGLLLFFKGPQVRQDKKALWFVAAVAAAGAVAFVLSLGPFLRRPDSAIRLPFAFLYGSVEPIRFFRAPARFAFAVTWSLAILGAFGLQSLTSAFAQAGRKNVGTVLGLGAIVVTAVEFFPFRTDLYRVIAKPTEFSLYLAAQEIKPFIQLPVTSFSYVEQLPFHHHPMANGYSGYAPYNHAQELTFVQKYFPRPEALALLHHWGINHIFVEESDVNLIAAAGKSSLLREEWSGSEGKYFVMTGTPPALPVIFQKFQARFSGADLLTEEIKLLPPNTTDRPASVAFTGMVPVGENKWSYENGSSILVDLHKPLNPNRYETLKLRYKISNWYDMRESAAIYWATTTSPQLNEDNKYEFFVQADGEFHDVTIPLKDYVVWQGSDPITQVRIDLGTRGGNVLELPTAILE